MTPRRKALVGMSGLLAMPRIARAQGALPAGNVRILVGFPPGGGTDVMSRFIAERLRQRGNLRGVLVENRPGASGALACEALKNAPADGTTVMCAPSAAVIFPPLTFSRPSFDPRADFRAITTIGKVPAVFAVAPSVGAASLADYVSWARVDARRLVFGATALGTNTHFFGLVLGEALGLKLDVVSYRGGAPLAGDLGAGHVPAGCGNLPDFLAQHQAGRLRILVASSPRRPVAARDIPSVAELGHQQAVSEGWFGLFAPAGVADATLHALNAEFAAVLREPDIAAQIAQLGVEPETSSAEAFASTIDADIAFWRPIVAASGFKAD